MMKFRNGLLRMIIMLATFTIAKSICIISFLVLEQRFSSEIGKTASSIPYSHSEYALLLTKISYFKATNVGMSHFYRTGFVRFLKPLNFKSPFSRP